MFRKQFDIKYVHDQLNQNRFIQGQTLSQLLALKNVSSINDAEFRVYSQFGDDGIIQFLIRKIKMPQLFIEFGVENYTESNTRFLLLNNNWKGLVMDGSMKNIEYIRTDTMYWRQDLTAVHAFITKNNINDIISQNNFQGEIGILSVDIDGNDYWVWDAIHVINPVIVIVEYNSVLGDEHPVSVPYQEDFHRTNAHYSNLLWGCSLPALNYLAKQKNYVLIGCNSAGNNAYFVRRDKVGDLLTPSLKEAFVSSKFRESRNQKGELTFLSGIDRINAIRECEVVNVISNTKYKIKDLYKL